jgi:DNA-binding XRE family transcriptional regulator
MKTHTEYQTILHDGVPAFVLVPFAEFQRVKPMLEQNAIKNAVPQEVVEAHVLHDVPLIRAWREHLNLTQDVVADLAGMKQSALARLERGEGKPRKATLKKLADAMGLTISQIEE